METVVFDGASDEQVAWCGGSDPRGKFVVGTEYEVEDRRVSGWHTKIKLKGFDGWFNSVCFSGDDDD